MTGFVCHTLTHARYCEVLTRDSHYPVDLDRTVPFFGDYDARRSLIFALLQPVVILGVSYLPYPRTFPWSQLFSSAVPWNFLTQGTKKK